MEDSGAAAREAHRGKNCLRRPRDGKAPVRMAASGSFSRGARPSTTVRPRGPVDRPGTRKVTINYLSVTFKIQLRVTLPQYFLYKLC